MWLPFRIFRTHREADVMHLEQMRNLIAESRALLRHNSPDTFAGRRTQEPFPAEDGQPQISRWLDSRELKPPE